METTVPTPQSYNFGRNQTLMWLDELFEAYYIGELNFCLTRLLKMAVGSPLFFEEQPQKRAELVGDIVSIMRYLTSLPTLSTRKKETSGRAASPNGTKINSPGKAAGWVALPYKLSWEQ